MSQMLESEIRVHCPACEHPRSELFCTYGVLNLVKCLFCDLIYVQEKREQKELISAFQHEDNQDFRRSCHRFLHSIRGVGSPGKRILHIGNGSEIFLDVAKEYGYQGVTIEESEDGTIFIQDEDEELFDVVWLDFILGRVTEPIPLLADVKKSLKPGGLLCIRTHNSESLPARICKGHHQECNPFERVNYWNKSSLRQLMMTNGFLPAKHFTREGKWHLAELVEFLYKFKFRKDPTDVDVNKRKYVKGLSKISNLTAPIFNSFGGGNELIGIYRRTAG